MGRHRQPRRFWTEEEEYLLIESYPDEPTSELAVRFGRSLDQVYAKALGMGLRKSADYLASPAACRLRRGDDVGAAFRYPKGHVPANKGTRRPGWAPGRMSETQFKKGQVPHDWRPIGALRLVDGYLYRKLTDIRHVPWTRNWRPVHVLLWEQHHGPVPPHHAVAFLNGDRADIRIENLGLITRRELAYRNSIHRLPKPLARVIQLRGAVQRQINRRLREARA